MYDLKYLCSHFGHLIVLFFMSFFFFNDTPTTEIYTLSLHDALPIYLQLPAAGNFMYFGVVPDGLKLKVDRKSTRLNSSHQIISYAVFCLKKKKTAFDVLMFRMSQKSDGC